MQFIAIKKPNKLAENIAISNFSKTLVKIKYADTQNAKDM